VVSAEKICVSKEVFCTIGAENTLVYIPKFEELVFYPYSSIDETPLICTNESCKYLCIFVDYMPGAYPTAIESCHMRDLVEFAQTNNIDRFVISNANEPSVSLLLDDYIEAARPE